MLLDVDVVGQRRHIVALANDLSRLACQQVGVVGAFDAVDEVEARGAGLLDGGAGQ